MQRLLLSLVLIVAAGLGSAGEMGSRAMSGWFNVTSENGWKGRRYMDGSQIIAEELATGPGGRIDVWRFYRRGLLSSEERDLNGDGRVDLQTRWDGRSGVMTSVMRDSNRRGINDVEIELVGNQRWEVREDRNLDGVTDRILFLNAPNDFLDRLGVDFAGKGDIVSAIPREYWRELHSDDAFTGSITDYFRFNSRGVLNQYGEWDGRRIAWRRCPADFVPMPTAGSGAVPPLAPQQPLDPSGVSYTGDPGMYEPPVTAVRDPFDLSSGTGDLDPYAGGTGAGPMQPPGYDDGLGGPMGGYDYGMTPGPQVQPRPDVYAGAGGQPPRAPGNDSIGRGAIGGDRTAAVGGRAEGLSINESSARAIPARMRSPGTAVKRR